MLIAALLLTTGLQDADLQDPVPPAPPAAIRIDPEIQRWLDRSPAREVGERGPIWDDGRVHGEVSASVGTGGWRAFGGEVSVPLRSGRMTLNYQQSEGEGLYRHPSREWPRWSGGAPNSGMMGADDRPMRAPQRVD